MSWISCLVLCCVVGGMMSLRDIDFPNPGWDDVPDWCIPQGQNRGRVPWILEKREPDYGWRHHTHRANIALAVNDYKGSDEEMRKMELQLEVEITKALFRNATEKIHENDLALFIHALLATNRNPRNFHGNDLVADLLHRVHYAADVHPFTVLALCNSHAITTDHLLKIQQYSEHDHQAEDVLEGRQIELKALALKAFACAESLSHLDGSFRKFRHVMNKLVKCVALRQNSTDGSFGNVYTTSLAVQALTAYDNRQSWNERKALDFLEREAYINVNMIKAYYIEMALNARKYNFIKDLYKGAILPPSLPGTDDRFYIQYTIKEGRDSDHYFTLTLKVEPRWSFFDVMKQAEMLSDKFAFKHSANEQNLPTIYAVAGTPNDAEENMFWRLCRQYHVNHDNHTSKIENYHNSPAELQPVKDDHYTLWYLNTECPTR